MTTAPTRPPPPWLLALAGTALAYAAAAWAASWLAAAPSYAFPLFPAAGIALASVLTFGWRMLPAVFVASFAVNAFLAPWGPSPLWQELLLCAVVGGGATLQAAIGAALVSRFVPQPMALDEPRDIALFGLLGGALACLTSASVAAVALWLIHGLPADSLGLNWWIWSTGDTLGVLIGAPVALTLIGQPQDGWKPRRLTVGVTLSVAACLMALSIKQVDQWERDRLQATFERDALHGGTKLAAALEFPMHALEALHGVFIASQQVTRDEVHLASQSWLAPERRLQAIGWADAVQRSGLADYESQVAAGGQAGFKVFNRSGAGTPADGDERLIVIRFAEPEDINAPSVGANIRSSEAARAAADRSILTDKPVASVGFRLIQETGDQTGVIIFRPVYQGPAGTPAERLAAAKGVVFVTLRMDDALQSVQGGLPSYLRLCIIDASPAAPQRRLAGPAGCDTRAAELRHEQKLDFAGRSWILRIDAARAAIPDSQGRNALLFSLIGLLATTMLGTLLLTVTGRARRIESAVTERTLALNREIAERLRTEAELRESEQRFRNILNNVPIGVVYTDLSANVKQVNPRFCELTGYTAEQLGEMNLQQLRPPEDRLDDLVLTRQLVEGEIPMFRRQGRYVRRDGREVCVQSVVTLLRDPAGQPHRIVGVVEDITEHLRLAEAERARALAEAANLAKSEFLSRMSHELRTPLNAMLGFAQLLELDPAHPLPELQRPWVAQIQSAGWHLLDMINDVLDLSRIESGTLNLQPHALDLNEVLASTRALVERDAQRRGIVITLELGAGLTRVTGDPTRVKQILTNLLSNAVKYNIDGGRIHVATGESRHEGSIDITVTDTGMGMTGDQLAQLFQPFNRLGRERSALEGTGIGLVISQRLAELMGGALRARSTAGEGSSFILTLPRAELPQPPSAHVAPVASTAGDYHQRIVHYVEDNETNVEVMRGVLSRRPQVRLDISITGLDGLAAIRRTRPDLVLLDMHLPDIDGLELLRHLKADPATANIPVVAVSADALAAQIDMALRAGAQQYLTKPISVSELLAVVDAVLDSAETQFG